MKGFISLHRKLKDNPVWSDPNYLKLWIFCLFEATHKERDQLIGNEIVKLKRGQFVTGRNSLSEKMNQGVRPKQRLNDRTWFRYLKNLETWGMLTIKSTNKYSVVTIDKYDVYQLPKEDTDQQTDQQLSNSCPTTDQQLSTNNNVNNANNVNKDIVGQPDNVPYKEIVDYLNKAANKNFRHTTPKTKDLIKRRAKEGFELNDFKKVIDIKCNEWINDDKMKKFLRPETLFGNKFEGYLNQNTNKPEDDGYNYGF